MIQKYTLLCFAFFACIASGFGQVDIIPVRTDVAGFATWTDTGVAGTTYVQLLTATSSTTTPAMDFTAYNAENLYFTARTYGGTNTVENTITVSVSTDNGTTWTSIGTRLPPTNNLTAMTPFDLSSYSGTQVKIRFTVAGANNSVGVGIDDITISGEEAPSDTSVEFASATYAANENGSSINLCVNIDVPSAGNATTAEIILVSSNNPHLTFTSTTITFPAGSSTQQCVSIPITDNSICADSNTYTFELQNVSGGDSAAVGIEDSTVLTVNDNEGSSGAFKTLSFEAGDDWGHTGDGAVSTTANKFYGTASYRLGTGNVSLTTDSIDISSYTNVTLSVAFASSGADSGEDLYLDISYDNGISWTGTGSIKLVDGYNNADINIGGTNAVDPTTVGSNPWTVAIPSTETQIRVRLRSVSLDNGEYYFVDDIILRGESCPSCTPTHTVSSFSPTSGPIGTYVTIQGTGFTAGSTVTFNDGITATIISQNATQMVVEVPAGTLTGAITIEESGCIINTSDFTLINTSDACGGLSDLIMTEIYDKASGSLGYIEIFNGTGNSIDLSNYSIRRYGDTDDLAIGEYTLYTFPDSTPSIANSDVLFGNMFSPGNTDSDAAHDFTYEIDCSNTGGNWSCGGFNAEDIFYLYNGITLIDVYIVPNTNLGYVAQRNTNTAGPNSASNPSDWTHYTTENTSNLGIFNFSGVSSGYPNVTTNLSDINCSNDAVLTTVATPGNAGVLTYQWYSNAPEQLGWTELTDDAIYNGTTTETLTISDVYDLNGYQYYVRVMEGGLDCYAASDAIHISLNTKTWNGSVSNDWKIDGNWTPTGVPTDEHVVVIPSATPYSPILAGTPPIPPTGSDPVYAKTLIVLSGADVELQTGQNLIVENCIINHGTIDLKNTANLVQVNEINQNSGNGNFFMERIVSDIENYNYIYWSSPIAGFNISGLPGSNTHRYYWSPTVTNANNTHGDWLTATGSVMNQGIGYIIRVSGATANLNVTLGGNGLGTPHNGTFTTPISKGTYVYADPADAANNYWNLLGNPYPSAISADEFITVNAAELMNDDPNPSVIGTIYLWRHQATPSAEIDNPFYENFVINYDGSNYVAYNATGANPPGEFNGSIASGQAFFVVMDESTSTNTVTFTNAMRYGDALTNAYNNAQFLRLASTQQESESTNTIERHRLWLDLIAPNNTSVSTLVGYVTGATNGKDRLFDGYETNATGLGFYSIVGYDRMGIQGRALPFDVNDTVPLGANLLQTGTYTIAINQLDGLFEDGQAIFLEDTYTNTIHNMRATPYTFHSEGGTFNDRFILRYTNATLSILDVTVDAGLTITELSNGHVKFSVGHGQTIQSVEIFDMLGRHLYKRSGSNGTEIYKLTHLSQATYIAKVTLSNGQVITKRAVKRQ